jgi:periplasmic protein TonB
VNGIRLPLAISVAGHAVCLALLVFFLSNRIVPPPEPIAKGGIEVAFEPALPQPEAPPPLAPAEPQVPPPAAELPPPEPQPETPAPLESTSPAPEPPAVAAEPVPPPPQTVTEPPPPPPPAPPRKLVVKKPPKPVPQRQEIVQPTQAYIPPIPAQPLVPQAPPARAAAPQTATAATPVPAPVPSPEASAGYRALLSAWLESHKRYPESARERGEEGHAILRFQVDRSGRVLDYSVTSTSGYADLDQAVEEMMRGATLPPFPAGMPQPRIEVSVTIRFSLRR